MTKFNTQMLPETQFHSHHEEYKITSHAEQNFEDDKNHIQVQCGKNIKLIDEALKARLQSVSLVVTSLLTSLHETNTEGLNKEFKGALDKFEKLSSQVKRLLTTQN